MEISFINFMLPPESELSSPANMESRELLPVPLGAIRAILSPSFILKEIFPKSTLGPYDLLIFSTCRKLAISHKFNYFRVILKERCY